MCSKATADWPFGVAYISVKDLSKAEKIIKEFKEIPAYILLKPLTVHGPY